MICLDRNLVESAGKATRMSGQMKICLDGNRSNQLEGRRGCHKRMKICHDGVRSISLIAKIECPECNPPPADGCGWFKQTKCTKVKCPPAG